MMMSRKGTMLSSPPSSSAREFSAADRRSYTTPFTALD